MEARRREETRPQSYEVEESDQAEIDAESSRESPDLLLLSTTTSLVHVSAFPTAETHASSLLSLYCLFAILPCEIPLPPLCTTT